MEATITNDILESYICCKYKAYLKIMGLSGIKSDYENLRGKLRNEVKHNALNKMCTQATKGQIIGDVALTASILEKNPLFILNTSIEGDHFSLVLDGIKNIKTNQQGLSYYAPMLFYEGRQIRKEQRLFLELCATFLFKYQAIIPAVGLIWHGKECKSTTVRLNTDSRKIEQIQLEFKKMCIDEEIPKLILNYHCQICEFQNHCYEQAHQEDNLSLIWGISEKEIKAFNRKGILTVTQLAHTFRPRRKRKNAGKDSQQRYHALQAMAIRDEKVYVLGTAQMPDSPVYIYIDVESDPDRDFIYLIGLIIVENDVEEHLSFWADNQEQEAEIFEQFVTEVTRREEFVIFCYGSYERTYIKKMRKTLPDQTSVDRILNALVNILSIIYDHIYFPTYSNGLKYVGKYVGFSWTEPDASGIQSIVWRSHWESSHNAIWKQKLLTYNIEDCIALKIVAETIRGIITTTEPNKGADNQDINLSVDFVEEIEKLSDYYTWRKLDFAHPDFEFINKRAYFDYQQERVYIRSSKTIRKAKATKPPSPNRNLSASKKITIVATQCPTCNSKNVINGIIKQVRTQGYRCI
ncbi:MAG: TM0106 family RecB-like putative nuclease [Chloroflexota bacterium]